MRHERIKKPRLLLMATGAAAMVLGAAPATAQQGDPATTLTQNLRALDRDQNNFEALIAAGNAAVDVGEMQTAAGLFSRAEERAPGRPEPQAGMGRVMANLGDPVPAMSYFQEAVRRGGRETDFAVDRGLAKDLMGDIKGAQADYRLGIGRAYDGLARRRLALSLGIAGERTAAMAFLQPLLSGGDPAARRVRAFVLALTGDLDGARGAIEREMPGSSAQLAPFLAKLPYISDAQKAAAVHLGLFPEAGEMKMADRSNVTVATPAPAPARSQTPQGAQFDKARREAEQRNEARRAAAQRENDRREKERRRGRVQPVVDKNPKVTYEKVERPALSVSYEPMEPATTAPPPTRVGSVDVPAARGMELPSEIAQRSATPAGERLASIDEVLAKQTEASAPAVASAPPPSQPRYEAPPPSRPRYEAKPQPKVEPVAPAPKPAPAKSDIGVEGDYWVQVAGGSRQDAMGFEWRRFSREAGDAVSGQKPHVTHGVEYFRLLLGPFSSRDTAQELTNKLRGNGLDVFTWKRSPERLKITPL